MIGCNCAVCRSPDPRDQRLRSSIYVETPECSWVVDTGTDFRTQALRENIRDVDAVVFTHSHTDHIMGFDDLRRFSHARGSMPVYASAETMRDLKRVFQFAFENPNPFPGYLKPEPHEIDRPFELGATVITPLPVPHGNSIVNGYLFSRGGEKLVAYFERLQRRAECDCRSYRRREGFDHRRSARQTAPDSSQCRSGAGSRCARSARGNLFYAHRPRAPASGGIAAPGEYAHRL